MLSVNDRNPVSVNLFSEVCIQMLSELVGDIGDIYS